MKSTISCRSGGLPLAGVIPLLRNQFPMPAEDGVRCDNCGQFPQCLTPESLTFDGQSTALAVSQQDSLLA